MSYTQRKLREIEAETRFFALDRALFMLVAVAFTVLAMAFVASTLGRMSTGLYQVLHVHWDVQ